MCRSWDKMGSYWIILTRGGCDRMYFSKCVFNPDILTKSLTSGLEIHRWVIGPEASKGTGVLYREGMVVG